MKKKSTNPEDENAEKKSVDDSIEKNEFEEEAGSSTSIQDFIEKKKLQNRILKTMLENMTQTEIQPNNNKNSKKP